MGEVNQTRLQVFSVDGAQVFDSAFRLGNLIDWQLVDQQGAHLTDGTYLFLVTVKDFSANLTQKYGTATLEQEQVSLAQSGVEELASGQATALAANRLSEGLSPVDRIAAAGINPTTTTSPAGNTTTGTEPAGTSTAEVTTVPGENATGTGTQNRIAKWTDNAGTLGDSTIFENSSGQVGIGTINPETTLQVVAPAVPGIERVARFGISDDPNNYMAVENGGSTPGLFTPVLLGNSAAADGAAINIQGRIVPGADTGGLAVFAMDAYRSSLSPILNRPIFRIRNWDQEYFKILANGNVGIGTTNPINRLHVEALDIYGTAVHGNSSGGNGVYGKGGSSGVYGYSSSGNGVYGDSSSGNGVYGYSSSGYAVRGSSSSGYGVFGYSSSGYAGYFSGKAKVAGNLEVSSCTGCTTAPSDRALKANISSIDPRAVLDRLAALPISQWNYKSDETSVRHVGPMAQDFRAAFDLGKDDLHIDMIDANGVTMASVQALYQMMLEKEKKNEQLADEVRRLRAQLQQQQAQLNQVKRSVRRRAAKR
jgi:hypothetical protein